MPDKFFRSSVHADLSELPRIDPSVAHIARVYDFWLGGKDNISQVVSQPPYSGRTVVIQARHASYSNMAPLAVRRLSGTYMGVMSVFFGRAS